MVELKQSITMGTTASESRARKKVVQEIDDLCCDLYSYRQKYSHFLKRHKEQDASDALIALKRTSRAASDLKTTYRILTGDVRSVADEKIVLSNFDEEVCRSESRFSPSHETLTRLKQLRYNAGNALEEVDHALSLAVFRGSNVLHFAKFRNYTFPGVEDIIDTVNESCDEIIATSMEMFDIISRAPVRDSMSRLKGS
jgi:hypothetical protein